MEQHNTNSLTANRTDKSLMKNLENRAIRAKDNDDHVGINESVLASTALELIERIENGDIEVEL